jgi:hypothetical protein
MSNSRNRSYEKITRGDLGHLANLALTDFKSFFQRNARRHPYSDRLMLVCLCQGAARHYVDPYRVLSSDREGGVHDFDVWGFFRQHPDERPFPPGRQGFADFGLSRFGRDPDDEPRFTGRRVDVLGRSIEVQPSKPRSRCNPGTCGRSRPRPRVDWQSAP